MDVYRARPSGDQGPGAFCGSGRHGLLPGCMCSVVLCVCVCVPQRISEYIPNPVSASTRRHALSPSLRLCNDGLYCLAKTCRHPHTYTLPPSSHIPKLLLTRGSAAESQPRAVRTLCTRASAPSATTLSLARAFLDYISKPGQYKHTHTTCLSLLALPSSFFI